MTLLYIGMAVLAGTGFAVQGPTNAALGRRTGRLRAALISFACGVLVLSVLVMLIGNGDFRKIRGAELWQLLGGVYGAYGVAVTILTIPELGTAMTLMLTMMGQLLMGTLIDAEGWFCTGKIPITAPRLLGIAAVVAGVVMIYLAGRDSDTENSGRKKPLMALLAVSAGLVGAVQSPTNASLSARIGSLEGTMVSFAGGFAVILLMNLLCGANSRKIGEKATLRLWMFLGGLYGAFGVFLNIVAAPELGIALLVGCGMFGQMIGGLAVDSFGWLEVRRIPLKGLRAAGIAGIAAGVLLINAARMNLL